MAHKMVYIGTGVTAPNPYHRDAGWYVAGSCYGPMLYANCGGLEELIDEFDERFGKRVDWEKDRVTLRDYLPEEPVDERDDAWIQDAAEAAMNCGDMRMNDGGTTVWVDPYEWFEGPFPTLSDTLRHLGRTSL